MRLNIALACLTTALLVAGSSQGSPVEEPLALLEARFRTQRTMSAQTIANSIAVQERREKAAAALLEAIANDKFDKFTITYCKADISNNQAIQQLLGYDRHPNPYLNSSPLRIGDTCIPRSARTDSELVPPCMVNSKRIICKPFQIC